jgi:hypothetical protein
MKIRGVGKETVIGLQPGTVAIEGYFKFYHVVSCKTSYFHFHLLQLEK